MNAMTDVLPADLAPALRAEFRKVLTLPGLGWGAAVVAGVALVATLASTLTADAYDPTGEPVTGAASLGLYPAFGVAALAAAVLGVLMTAGEYRHHTMAVSALFTPDRDRLAAAKLVLPAAAGMAAALLAGLLGLAVLGALGRGKAEFGLTLAGVIGGGLWSALCWGVIGAGLGLVLRNTAGALAVLLGWLLLAEPLLWLLADVGGTTWPVALMPGSATVATIALGSFTDSGFLAPTPAAYVVLALWAAALGALGWYSLRDSAL